MVADRADRLAIRFKNVGRARFEEYVDAGAARRSSAAVGELVVSPTTAQLVTAASTVDDI
jgi:hypothetical protein